MKNEFNEFEDFSNMLIIPKNKLLIDWKEKSGCTTIIKMVFRYLGILDDALNYNDWVHKYRMEVFYKKYNKVNSLNISEGDYKNFSKIKFVRNPYTRAVSSYLHVMDNLEKYKNIYKNAFSDMSFFNFLKKIKDIKKPNGHWQKQSRRIEKQNINFFDKIIKIEEIEKEIEEVNKIYNTSFIYNRNSSHHTKKSDNIDFVGNIKYSIIKNNIPDYIYFYNNKIKNMVDIIYGDDIKIYKYKFSDLIKYMCN